jgi:hypothetical protein
MAWQIVVMYLRIWKEMLAAHLKVLSYNLSGETKVNNKLIKGASWYPS